MKTLRDVKVGERAIVAGVSGSQPLRRRILDMGLTKGAVIQVSKAAPLGDPIEIVVRGYALTLRKADAKIIRVEGEKAK
jgi:ferrous iron transport protein A